MMTLPLPHRSSLPAREPVALCLAGGGFRAAAFHLGAVWRLNELGLLTSVTMMHAVSGGALLEAALGVAWRGLIPHPGGQFGGFESLVATPMEQLLLKPFKLHPGAASWMRPKNWQKLQAGQFTESDRLADILDSRVCSKRTLDSLGDVGPSLRWSATNLRTGGCWELSPERVGEPKLGYREPGRMRLADAVAACLIDPIRFPPFVVSSRGASFDGGDINADSDELRRAALLCDGSLSDPMGVMPVIGQASTVIVIDGGSAVTPDVSYNDWVGERLVRALAIQHDRAVDTHRRWLVDGIRSGRCEGTYISLAAYHRDYGVDASTGYSPDIVERIAKTPAKVAAISRAELARTANHGYTVADAAIRRFLPQRIRTDSAIRLPYADDKLATLEPPSKLSISTRAA